MYHSSVPALITTVRECTFWATSSGRKYLPNQELRATPKDSFLAIWSRPLHTWKLILRNYVAAGTVSEANGGSLQRSITSTVDIIHIALAANCLLIAWLVNRIMRRCGPSACHQTVIVDDQLSLLCHTPLPTIR